MTLVQKELKNAYIGWNTAKVYQEVEWIASSGTQYIDTWLKPNNTTKSQIKFMNLQVTGYVIYWMYNGSDTTSYRMFNYGSVLYLDIASSRINWAVNTLKANVDYELEVGNNYVKDIHTNTNIISWTSVASYTGNTNIMLNGNNSGNISKNRRYYVKIWDNGTLVRDMIPCYRIADSVIGMYDQENDVFYTNAGTGTFTKGNDVN